MKKISLNGEIPVNCYILENGKECFIVDPGYEKDKLIDYVIELGLTVKGFLLTHGHIDHIGALDAFDVPIYMMEIEQDILFNNFMNGFTFYKKKNPYNLEDLNLHFIEHDDMIPFGDSAIRVIHTPGHTKGGICFLWHEELYSGDTLFKGSIGRYDFPTGRQEILMKSVINLIENLPENTIIYPAHGPSTTIKQEPTSNPYYIHW